MKKEDFFYAKAGNLMVFPLPAYSDYFLVTCFDCFTLANKLLNEKTEVAECLMFCDRCL